MPFEYSTAQPLNTEQMDTILFFYVLVQYSNFWSSTKDIAAFEYSGGSNTEQVRYSDGP